MAEELVRRACEIDDSLPTVEQVDELLVELRRQPRSPDRDATENELLDFRLALAGHRGDPTGQRPPSVA